jgi:hypothetical protein
MGAKGASGDLELIEFILLLSEISPADGPLLPISRSVPIKKYRSFSEGWMEYIC